MKKAEIVICILLLFAYACNNFTSNEKKKIIPPERNNKPSVRFTFDDGITYDLAGFNFEEWNEMLLSHLEKENLKAIFFVTGKNKLDEKG